MKELPIEYWNALASQLIVISTLLGGFSLSLLFSLNENSSGRWSKIAFRVTLMATIGFMISIFAFTKVIMVTTPGYPLERSNTALLFPRTIGTISFYIGLISILAMISLSGILKNAESKKFAIIIGVVSLIIIAMMLS